MARKPQEFTIGGTKFEGTFLDPITALDGFSVLVPQLGPLFARAGEDADVGTLITEACKTAGLLPHFAPIFRKVYKVQIGDRMVPLHDFWEDVFLGKPALLIGWLAAALKAEYESVFLEEGQSILADLAASFGFRIESNENGSSGASSPTTE